MMLYRITAPHFCAGLVTDLPGRVVTAAPILRWAVGKTVAELFQYCHKKRWRMALVQIS
jgi:hypothetical protein